MRFVHETLPQRVRFASGEATVQLAEEIARLDTSRLMVISTETQQPLAHHVADRLPVAGWGLTEDGRKRTGTDPSVLPRAVVYDATLTMSLPLEMSIASGLNALAHCVDSMWAPRADPINGALAVEGIRALAAGLPVLTHDPADLAAREELLYGAYLSAVAFASAGSGLHHKICHVLGGMFDLPHAQTHAVVLPHVLALNAQAAPAAERRIAGAFGSVSAAEGLRSLRERVAAPDALHDYGMPESGIPAAARAVLEAAPTDNPAPLTPDNVTALRRAAWEGRRS